MNRILKKRFLFSTVYTVVLALFTLFVLLDTFVIPHGYGGRTVSDGKQAAEDLFGEEVAEKAGDGTPIMTENSYTDGNLSVSIETIRLHDTQVYVAEVILSSAAYFKTAFAEDTYGRNIREKSSEIAERVGAIFAVNGDFYGFRNEGFVIRNGVLYRDTPYSSSRDALVVDAEGKMFAVREKSTSAQTLLSDGAWQALSFGPVLLENSEICVDEDDEIGKMESNPRTAVGMIEPLHYIFVVSDGRTRESEGLSLLQMAELMESYGCTFAYNLDGGGSSTMVFNGRVINNPTDGQSGGERKVSDIVCIGY